MTTKSRELKNMTPKFEASPGQKMSSPIPLPALFARCLSSASKAFNLPTIDDQCQELIQSSLTDIRTLQSRITGLSLFSPNETLDDISTRDLIYLLVPYVYAQVQDRVRTTEREDRLASLEQSDRNLQSFVLSLENYQVIPEDEVVLYGKKASSVSNAASRRELKIKQYQKEKDLRARIEAIRKRRNQLPVNSNSPTDFELILSLLPSSKPSANNEDDDDDEDDSSTDEVLRDATLLLVRLCFAQAQSQLQSMDQELQLLRNAPPPMPHQPRPDEDRRGKQKESENDMWKLDLPKPGGLDGKGPLLDSAGKPLRPFTILPAGMAERARLQAQVFRPDHNLPTMSIDEYLEIERQRGKFISGGGPASENAPTSSEQLALDAEMDGTADGEEKAETKRLKDEKWAMFTDENPRGAGNTMNRG